MENTVLNAMLIIKKIISALEETYIFYTFLFSHLFLLILDYKRFVRLLYEYTETPLNTYEYIEDQAEDQSKEIY